MLPKGSVDCETNLELYIGLIYPSSSLFDRWRRLMTLLATLVDLSNSLSRSPFNDGWFNNNWLHPHSCLLGSRIPSSPNAIIIIITWLIIITSGQSVDLHHWHLDNIRWMHIHIVSMFSRIRSLQVGGFDCITYLAFSHTGLL